MEEVNQFSLKKKYTEPKIPKIIPNTPTIKYNIVSLELFAIF